MNNTLNTITNLAIRDALHAANGDARTPYEIAERSGLSEQEIRRALARLQAQGHVGEQRRAGMIAYGLRSTVWADGQA